MENTNERKNNERSQNQDISQAEESLKNVPNKGSEYLIDKYNVNDQAHSDSSIDDFIKTTSNFTHENDENSKQTD